MAEKRMFNKTLMLSDSFSALSKNAQLLYLFLNLQADDDGICGNTRAVCRMCGCSGKALQELIGGGWLLAFEKEEVAVTHWLIHNQIRRDRYKPSLYRQVASRLKKGADGAYVLCEDGCQNGNQPATQGSIDKNSIDKNSIDKNSIDQNSQGEQSAGCSPPGPLDAACDDDIDYDKVLYHYQVMCPLLAPCDALTPQLRVKITDYYRMGYDHCGLLNVFMKANGSAFLQGKNKSGWQADLGWLLEPLHVEQVTNGRFDDWNMRPGA